MMTMTFSLVIIASSFDSKPKGSVRFLTQSVERVDAEILRTPPLSPPPVIPKVSRAALISPTTRVGKVRWPPVKEEEVKDVKEVSEPDTLICQQTKSLTGLVLRD